MPTACRRAGLAMLALSMLVVSPGCDLARSLFAIGNAPKDPKATARSLALSCQSVPFPMSNGAPFGDAWLPREVRELGGQIEVTPTGATVYQGTRDRGRGYSLVREKRAGKRAKVVWRFERWTENQTTPQTLAVVRLAPGAKLALSELVRRAHTEYDRRLASDPRDLRTQKERALFLATLSSCADARAATEAAANALPESYWPHFTFALVEWQMGKPKEARGSLSAWVKARPSYSRYTYLAQYDRLVGHVDDACKAMQAAMRLPIREEPGDNENSSARAYEIAASAFEAGRYACALDIARRLEKGEPDAYTRKHFVLPFRSIVVSALYLSGHRADAAKLVREKGLREKDPFYRNPESTLPALAKAVLAKKTRFVRAWRPENTGLFEEQAFMGLVTKVPHTPGTNAKEALGCGFLLPRR